MRGRVWAAAAACAVAGITPAYAGKRCCQRLLCPVLRDHPRVCGEENCLQLRITEAMGSPPRMRGRVLGPASLMLATGITPAYAGKSGRCRDWRPCAQDHPRVCGEENHTGMVDAYKSGSPPRMRGRVRYLDGITVKAGITPAYAGKSLRSYSVSGGREDHPRVCGEETVTVRLPAPEMGSPPRMRGREHSAAWMRPRSRITPAYAGKSGAVLHVGDLG